MAVRQAAMANQSMLPSNAAPQPPEEPIAGRSNAGTWQQTPLKRNAWDQIKAGSPSGSFLG
ncbi:hypothetical protein CCMA1212_005019 [Trichoderma ghanense]|uniref:Uncharacterized protein n=1 Tax=Trichoderma ghanense TaxID=65468 RepID=A0ABY2H3P4_9HYPO